MAVHVVLQPLLLGLELLVPLLQLPLVLRQPMLLCVTVPQVPGYGGDQRQDRVGPRVQVQVQVGLGLGQGAGYGGGFGLGLGDAQLYHMRDYGARGESPHVA